MNELHLFAGAGGGILAGALLGHRCIGAVEIEPYAQAVLLARQRDGIFPRFPIFSDVRRFHGRPWRGRVDIVAGGFPCQDISVAGKGAGIDGERSGLWREMARIVGEVRPQYVFVENSPALVNRGLGVVLGDLAALGFDAAWRVLSAAELGAPHLRERIWILGHRRDFQHSVRDECKPIQRWHGTDPRRGDVPSHTNDSRTGWGQQFTQSDCTEDVSNANRERWVQVGQSNSGGKGSKRATGDAVSPDWGAWPSESGICRVFDGMAYRAHRIRAGGNGQVSRVAAAAFAELAAKLNGERSAKQEQESA